MKIDAHHHLWDLGTVDYPWILDETPRFFGDHAPIRRNYLLPEFRADAEAAGFEASVHIQVGAEDPWAEAVWVDAVAQSADWAMVQVVFCDLTADGLEQTLTTYQALPSVRGVRQIVGRSAAEDAATGTNDLLDNPAFLRGLAMAAEMGLSFDLQLTPPLLDKMAEVLVQVPKLAVALCHAGSPQDRSVTGLAAWGKSLRRLSDLPNVTCKLSGLGMFEHDWTAQSVEPIVREIERQFGADRMMFGSNFPVDSLSSTYPELIKRYRSLLDWEAPVFGETARRFYRF